MAFARRNGVNGTPTLFISGRRLEAGATGEQIRTLIHEPARGATAGAAPGARAGHRGAARVRD
ncbi:MAG: hypothetical protein IT158_28895 [Bryobacterales bacterium]|nr:hypothetical protein [Bryobacterales bacterium]